MRMTARVEHLAEIRRKNEQRLVGAERAVERHERRLAREHALRDRVALERERLTPEDRVVATYFRLPKDAEERARVARELLMTTSGRSRSHREVAAIMGIAKSTVTGLLAGPAKRKAREGPKARARRPEPEVVEAEPLPQWLRSRRRAAGLSQLKLSELVGVRRSELVGWERGEGTPTPSQYLALVRALDLG